MMYSMRTYTSKESLSVAAQTPAVLLWAAGILIMKLSEGWDTVWHYHNSPMITLGNLASTGMQHKFMLIGSS